MTRAKVESKPHADNPMLCGYTITGDSPAQVQFAISELMNARSVAWSEFSHPIRHDGKFVSVGTVLSYADEVVTA